MQSLLDYINTFSQVIFGIDLLYSPSALLSVLNSNLANANASSFPMTYWVSYFMTHWNALFSLVFWLWFAWFTFYLLILLPFKWFKSLVKRK